MKFYRKNVELIKYEIQDKGFPKIISNHANNLKDLIFDQVNFELELNDKKCNVYVNAFSCNLEDYMIPTKISNIRSHKLHYLKVNNKIHKNSGYIRRCQFDYDPRDISTVYYNQGTYGCFQIFDNCEDTVFAYNNFNNESNYCEVGIGNSFGNNKNWTFENNAYKFSTKTLTICLSYLCEVVEGNNLFLRGEIKEKSECEFEFDRISKTWVKHNEHQEYLSFEF